MNKDNGLSKFLNRVASQKEVAVIITKDENELKDLTNVLEDKKFTKTDNVFKILDQITSPAKILFVIEEKLPKDIYDFLVQYPTGQIQIFNREKRKMESVSPVYKDVSVVFTITKENLMYHQKKGFSLLEHAGMAYQD